MVDRPLDEHELIERAKRGDASAYEALVRAHQGIAFRTAFLIARDRITSLSGQAFNMGGGPNKTTSLLELIRLLEPIAGRKLAVTFDSWRTGDQRYYVSDTQHFVSATGWRAQVDIEAGVERLAQWLVQSGRLSTAQAIAS